MVLMTEYWKNPRMCGCCDVGHNGDARLQNFLAICFPHCCFGRAVAKSYHPQSKTDLGDCCFFTILSCLPGAYTLFRMGHHIKGTATTDCLFYCCCSPFCLPYIQVANESDSRMTRPFSYPQRNTTKKEWMTELFSTEEPEKILYGCCCSCCAFGDVGYLYGRMGWLYGVFCMHPAVLRFDMRHEYNIEGSCIKDLGATVCCPGFSYVQMRKEVEVKGAAFGRFDYGDSTFLSMSMSPSFDESYVQMRKEVEVKGAAFGRFDYGDSTFLSMSMSPSFDESSSFLQDDLKFPFAREENLQTPYPQYHQPSEMNSP